MRVTITGKGMKRRLFFPLCLASLGFIYLNRNCIISWDREHCPQIISVWSKASFLMVSLRLWFGLKSSTPVASVMGFGDCFYELRTGLVFSALRHSDASHEIEIEQVHLEQCFLLILLKRC